MEGKVYWITAWLTFALVFFVKVFISLEYRSTDFEVHRNWLAITHSLPISQWYLDETSPWTLDYPPFFAYFEYALSHLARLFDPKMLIVSNLGYDSIPTIVFQRGSVILADCVYVLGCFRFIMTLQAPSLTKLNPDGQVVPQVEMQTFVLDSKRVRILVMLICNAGLLMVDHIHFQYNGFLLGILLLSLAALNGDRPLESAFWFAVLLNFKHIYLYIAPIYVVYLLRVYCLGEGNAWWDLRSLKFMNVAKLALVLIIVFGLSLGPFIYMGQMPQLISRLFPFKRGLVHAYWAPNAWALYLFVDLVLARLLFVRSGPSSTSGLVGSITTRVLPEVPPVLTILLTVAFMMPLLWKVWQKPTKSTVLAALVPISMCSFFFGWHVHEKAILLTIIPATLIAMEDPQWCQIFLNLVWIGHFSLFPLFINQVSSALLYFLMLGFWYGALKFCERYYKHFRYKTILLDKTAYVMAAWQIPVSLLVEWLLPWLLPQYEFLPLLVTSVFSAFIIAQLFYSSISLVLEI
jgi:alpha-1,3-glucosyltransferase